MNRTSLAPVGFGLIGLTLVVAYVASPPSRGAEWIVTFAQLLSAGVIVTALLVHRPVRPVPWGLLAVGIALWGVASAVAADDLVSSRPLAFPGGAEAATLLAYPSLLVATIGFTSGRRNFRDLLAGSEPIIYTISLTALMWISVTGPYAAEGTMPLGHAPWVWIPALFDIVLATLAWRGVERGDASRSLFQLMMLAFGVAALVHLATGYAADKGEFEAGGLLAASRMFAPLLLGLISTLPVFASISARNAPTTRAHWTQFVGLIIASLVPLGALILMLFGDTPSTNTVVVVSLATVCVIVLALARTWRLVDQVRVLTEQRGQDRLAAMVEHSSDIVMLTDVDGRITYVSPGLRATLGRDPESFAGRHLLDVVAESDRPAAARQIERLVEFGHGGTVEFEVTIIHASGEERRAAVVVANLVGGAAVDGIVTTFRDITEQRNLERQLSHRAYHDELTGLANRALFLDRMDHALRVTRPESDPIVVLFVDLDDFKSVNDVLGHAVGDQLLRTVADRVHRSVGSGDTTARLGGDEFAVLLEDRGGIERAIDVAERVLDSLREPVSIAGYDVAVLASIGISVANPGASTTSLLRDADIAMYEAKRAGKGQIRIFDPAMRLVATKHVEYRSDLARAIERDELRLVYMPFVDLKTGLVTGAEALVRWHHHEHGDIPASEFIPVAERSGAIVPIGYWILDEALAQAAKWQPGLSLSVNVSAVQIRQPDFVPRVIETVQQHRMEPSSILFELTESVLVDEGDRADEVVRELRSHGFKFAIDDFGTGYCSLSYLQRNPVDLLKIDRAAIDELGDDPRGNTLARTILQMAEALDLPTAAEGIETTIQLRELRRHGCDIGQGYLLSHPLEADELELKFGVVDVLALT